MTTQPRYEELVALVQSQQQQITYLLAEVEKHRKDIDTLKDEMRTLRMALGKELVFRGVDADEWDSERLKYKRHIIALQSQIRGLGTEPVPEPVR